MMFNLIFITDILYPLWLKLNYQITYLFTYSRFAINPARDFGPRLFSAIFYGRQVFSAFNFFFWIPIVGPIGGAVCAALLYKFLFQVKTCTDSNSIQIDTF